ncbi:diguanylate phosphodiesterase [Marinobacterium aestuarii]|uniref:Diguanylate phosphodiesterase n=1 Tax=Marinobacterium aestuarii TaxID=1821621 RepID=A0A1A9F624_9GAMM|nr:EAL domain-containing protein [Marinobacterium aestuarii]ANG65321.1 diguanylate phosphodiesterase [Marinobacterium aestuarii]
MTNHIDTLIEPPGLEALQAQESRMLEGPDDISIDAILSEILHAVRLNLGMEVAFISEFDQGQRSFRFVDADNLTTCPIAVGGSGPLEQSYCQRVVDGRLPELIRNAGDIPEALTLAATTQLPVGAHLSVPIRFRDGSLFGSFCCFSTRPNESLGERDILNMRLYAQLCGTLLERITLDERHLDIKVRRIKSVLRKEKLSIVYQPIYCLTRNAIIGYEALSRFHAEPLRSPDKWFAEAEATGLLAELECFAVSQAIAGLSQLPADSYVAVNITPETVLNCATILTLLATNPRRIVLELTEHASIDDYTRITQILEPLRQQGLRLAVDDAGAGYASFRHILQLKPDIIKLDRSLISGIDHNEGCIALAAALIVFAEKTGSKIVAEGVETQAEINTLRQLKVAMAQGFFLCRPKPLAEVPK